MGLEIARVEAELLDFPAHARHGLDQGGEAAEYITVGEGGFSCRAKGRDGELSGCDPRDLAGLEKEVVEVAIFR